MEIAKEIKANHFNQVFSAVGYTRANGGDESSHINALVSLQYRLTVRTRKPLSFLTLSGRFTRIASICRIFLKSAAWVRSETYPCGK
ncbi:KDGP aldolase [Caproiciproducens sp.]|uniref:KDGP aldolase n=1 Tax=Caproiciproducens sp. TaxID=1954376 RepID=UPI003FA41F37